MIIDDKNINGFWDQTSKFLCTTNTEQISKITESFSTDFALPNDVKEVDFFSFARKIFFNSTTYFALSLLKDTTK